ncbi:J domain-containing protein [Xanthomonas maliensis]|uniref:J domain-containing protein n=1 Tax=Xanthomonas maliensis TaxID=1321368 RepID=UPI0003A44BAD|nr:J domain-containing protein [Xanthomonas maliensis]KAB7768450.1 J domain-containing protein [Xanthomonas maliensis]
MSWALAALGLSDDADERSIKRAYAARLKLTRPDEDPQGFQQLHETYQAALAWWRTQQPSSEVSEHDDAQSPLPLPAAPAAESAPQTAAPLADIASPPPARRLEHPPAAPVSWAAANSALAIELPAPIDVAATADAIVEQACTQTTEALAQWLQAQPTLWSLQHKPIIGQLLAERLLQQRPGICEDSCDLLIRCFDWDQLGSEIDPHLIGQLRQAMHKRWLLEPAGESTLHWHLIHRMRIASSPDQARALVGKLRGVFSWSKLVGAALLPANVNKVLQLLAAFGHPHGSLPPQFNRQRVVFWSSLANGGHANAPRLLVGLARSALVGTAIGILTLLLTLWAGRMDAVNLALGLALATVAVWLGWFVITALIAWQSRDEHAGASQQAIFWRLAFIPVLVCLGVLLIHSGSQRILGSMALVPALLLAVRRYMQRARLSFEFKGWSFLLLAPLFKLGALIFVFSEIAGVGALVLWAMDVIKHRGTIAQAWRSA